MGRARILQVLPAYVALPAPMLPIGDRHLLELLTALIHVLTITGAASICGLSERTFYRKLAAVRRALHLPPRLYRGRASMVLQTLLAALARAPEQEG